MKLLLASLAALISAIYTAQAQEQSKPFTFKGNLSGVQTPNGYVYLQGWIDGNMKTDSAKLIEDQFVFAGKTEPTLVKVYVKRLNQPYYMNPIQLFLDGGTINLTATYDTTQATYFRNVKIIGSASQSEWGAFDEASKKRLANVDTKKLQEDYKTAEAKNDTVQINAIKKSFQAYHARRRAFTKEYIRQHPESYVSLYLLNNLATTHDDKELTSVKELFLAMNPVLQGSATGKKLGEGLASASKGQLMGKPAGDFTQPAVDGKPVKLSDYKGKYVLLDFWASWCGPCRAENPNVLKVYQAYKDKGFAILAVSLDKDAEKWKKAIADDQLPWTHVSDLKADKNGVVQQFGIAGIPDNFLIDPSGIVIARGLRGDALAKKLAEVFSK